MTRRRFLIPALLLFTAVLWSIAAWRYSYREAARSPAAAARIIEADLHRRYAALQLLLKDKLLLDVLFDGRESSAGFKRWTDVPCAIFLYEDGVLRAWNSGSIPAPKPGPLQPEGAISTSTTGCSIRIARGLYKGRSGGERSFVAVMPVKWVYPVENEYLNVRFAASPTIPSEIEVAGKRVAGSRALHSPTGTDWGHVYLPATAALPLATPDAATLILGIAGLLAFAIAMHAAMLGVVRRLGPRWALLLPLVIIGGLRLLTYALPLPFGLRELPLFSSGLYGFSAALPSLGDLFVNALCLLAIAGFAAAHGLAYAQGSKKRRKNSVMDVLAGSALLAVAANISLLTVRIVQSLVVDSQIPFDVGRFYSANEYTAWGFATLGALAAGAALALRVLTGTAAGLLPNSTVRYSILLVLTLVLGLWVYPGIGPAPLLVAVAVWTVLFTVFLERPQPLTFAVASAPRIVTAMVVLALSVGSLLHYFLLQRTYQKDMVAFAERIAGQEDPLLEHTLSGALQAIAIDGDVQAFMRAPTPERRPLLDSRLEIVYLSKSLSGYTPRIQAFSAGGRQLFNRDTSAQVLFEDRLAFAIPKGTDGLFYNPTATDGRHYTARVRVPDSAGTDTLGTIYIDLLLRRTVAETVYPELLQPAAMRGAAREQSYPYAVYAGGLPVTQTEDYPFPEAAPATGGGLGALYRTRRGRRELWYTSGERVAIVVGPPARLLDSAALFSYLFAAMVVLGVVAIGYRVALKWSERGGGLVSRRIPRLSLRQSIHLSMLGLVLMSLLGVGAVTVALFNTRYREVTDERLRSTVGIIARSLRQGAAWRLATGTEQVDSVARSPRIRYRLAAIAEAQKADVSLFGTDGLLTASSQDEIYNRGLLPRQMRPEAYRALRTGQPVVLQRERVGSFAYQSAYVPLRADDGGVLGYVNVPFFSSEKELNDQISGILVTLVNLYAVLFLLATALAYLITRGLTRTLAVITERFRQVSLHRNEVLEWPYDDEIGLLVGEYNKMVKEVERSAVSLARSEREDAWREMARQVAHEIKNPLTPMKLQIQYLQRALREGRADVPQMAERVSGTLVEQIDNLSRIATEFSDFARLPEAKPEVLELGPLLQRTADLHRAEGRATGASDAEEGVDISVEAPPHPVVVRADHSHLLRALTNLVQNAVQAIPEDRAAHIRVRLQAGERVATVSIGDNGRGISTSERARIFRPYFTTKSSGTGLGLAMTRQMVEGWGGRIWFESKEGEGTEFFMQIPLAADSER